MFILDYVYIDRTVILNRQERIVVLLDMFFVCLGFSL